MRQALRELVVAQAEVRWGPGALRPEQLIGLERDELRAAALRLAGARSAEEVLAG